MSCDACATRDARYECPRTRVRVCGGATCAEVAVRARAILLASAPHALAVAPKLTGVSGGGGKRPREENGDAAEQHAGRQAKRARGGERDAAAIAAAVARAREEHERRVAVHEGGFGRGGFRQPWSPAQQALIDRLRATELPPRPTERPGAELLRPRTALLRAMQDYIPSKGLLQAVEAFVAWFAPAPAAAPGPSEDFSLWRREGATFDDLQRFWATPVTGEAQEQCFRPNVQARWLNFARDTLRDPDIACVVAGEDASGPLEYDETRGTLLEESIADPLTLVRRCFTHASTKVALVPVGLWYADGPGHANMLLIRGEGDADTPLRVELLDPHGVVSEDDREERAAVEVAVRRYVEAYAARPDTGAEGPPRQLVYVPQSEVLPDEGPQVREARISSKLRPGDGYCVPWTLLMAHLVMANPDLPTRDVMRLAFAPRWVADVDRQPYAIAQMVRGYTQLVLDALGPGMPAPVDVGEYVYRDCAGDATGSCVPYGRVVVAARVGFAAQELDRDGTALPLRKYTQAHNYKVVNPKRLAEAVTAFTNVPWPANLDVADMPPVTRGEYVYYPRAKIAGGDWDALYARVEVAGRVALRLRTADGQLRDGVPRAEVRRIISPERLARAQEVVGAAAPSRGRRRAKHT